MNDKGFSPFVGMDALRAFNKINKSLFDVHTKRYSGFTDEKGIQYEGTVENFGSEILLEPRKMLMDKPPIGDIFIKDTMSFYFDINYSGFVNTYDQQNMLCAKLKKDVLLSNREYFLEFDNVEKIYIPRSKSSSDPNVYRDVFYVTSTPPKMLIRYEDNTEVVELKLIDNTDVDPSNPTTKYYFHYGADTEDLIDEIDEDYGIILTKALTYKTIGFAFIWITCNALKTLPNVDITQSLYYNDLPLLTIGNNGHDGINMYLGSTYGGDALVFPYMNGDGVINHTFPYKWFIKVIAKDDEAYTDNPSKKMNNYSAEIKEIHLIKYDEERDLPNETPDVDIVITYDHEYSKMMLYANDLSDSYWSFRKPEDGEYDYDDREYMNHFYAYTKLTTFQSNSSISQDNILKAGFAISFDEKYHFLNEEYLLNTYTGIHIDNTSGSNINGIDTKYGTIHSLGDFDGLPPYFKYMLDENIRRSHLEMYSIRDKQDDPNQTILDKQVSGILIDSAMPKMTAPDIPEDAHNSIIYGTYPHYEDEMEYVYNDRVPPINSRNYLSEITYHDVETCGNSDMPEFRDEPKFIYHGNGLFTLDIVDELSPVDEYGRVFIISNDEAVYENNATTENAKPPRTFARICDIPTNYSQLIGIHGLAPIFVIDTDYVRTECNFTSDDKEIIYNLDGLDHWLGNKTVTYSGHTTYFPLVFPNIVTGAPMETYFLMVFPKYEVLNGMIPIDFVNNTLDFTVDSLTGYSDNSVLRIYIGGYGIDFKVLDGHLYLDSVPSGYIPRTNFDSRVSSYNTHLISGSFTGSTEAVITITVNETIWNITEMRKNGMLNSGFAFRFDKDDNIWCLNLDDHETYYSFSYNQKLSGEDLYSNRYDSHMSNHSDKVSDAFIYNTINPIENTLGMVSNNQTNRIYTNLTNDIDVTGKIDYSYQMNQSILNTQDSFYIIDPAASGNHTATSIEKCHMTDEGLYSLQHPTNCDLNIAEYSNKTNKLRMTNTDKLQPSLVVYDPNCNTVNTYDTDISISNMKVISNTRNMKFSDVLSRDFYDGKNAIYNIYRYNEFDDTLIVNYKENLSKYSREDLLGIVNDQFSGSDILVHPDDYTNSAIVEYIIQNTFTYDINGEYYTNNPNSTVYRRNNISLFAIKDSSLEELDFSGDVINITDEIFDERINVSEVGASAIPLFVYKLDIDEESITDETFEGFRMYDEEGNDISKYCLLIINMKKYVASINGSTITWIKSN